MASMNAALSGMPRFYLAFALALAPRLAAAQTPPATNHERPPLGSSITVEALGTLPASATVFALLDTAIPDVIADRIDTGGLNAGAAARVGAHGSTWTQTTYRIADADITDPGGSGTPLLTPGIAEWERVDVSTGIMPIDGPAPGMTVSLAPRRPFGQWTGWLDAFGSPSFLNAGGTQTVPPSLARLNTWAHGNIVAGGPASDRVGVFASGTWTRSSLFERLGTTALDSNLASVFLNLTAAPTSADHVRLTGWVQRTHDPLAHHAALAQPDATERDNALHAQGAWERQLADASTSVRLFGAYTIRGRSTELRPQPFVVIERLVDGPVTTLLDPGDGTDKVLHVGGRVNRAIGGDSKHMIAAGVDFSQTSSTQQAAFTGLVGERVNGVAARVWDLRDPAASSSWSARTLAAFVSDTATLAPRVTLNGGLRFETIRGFASDAADQPAVSWNDFYPRAGLHVALTNFWNIATFAQYGRYGHRLPLRDLAYGDPTAPTGRVYRWTGGNLLLPSSLGPLVQRIGPGSGGSATLSTIDPALRRPSMQEMIFGFESRPHATAFARMAAIARRESPLIGVVDVGVPESTYTQIGVPDPGIDRIGTQDDQILIFYNRSPSTFGADRYLLTNPDDHEATFVGVDFVGEVHAKQLFLIAGGTAGRSEGISANRGYGPLENDAAVLGEVFIDPNARGHAQGRVFTERGYTIKTAISYQFDYDVNFAVVGRYQDGQHFARMVVLDTLNQGAEAVRAFRNGRTRFTFSMTVDARLQKGFTVGTRRFLVSIDAYNVFNQALSVEEVQVTGAGSRQTSAVQPPRVVHIGVRIPF
jgi:hypothetical protein